MKESRLMEESGDNAGRTVLQEEDREFETMNTPVDTRIDRLTDRADEFFSGLLF